MSTFNIGSVSGNGNVVGNNAHVQNVEYYGSHEDDDWNWPDSHNGRRPAQRGAAAKDPAEAEDTDGTDDADEAGGSLRPRELRAFSRCYTTPPRADALLRRAGLRRETLPAFYAGLSALDFWTELSDQLGNGVVRRGRQRLLAAARNEFPAQPAFREGR